jgi:hypothetical protein
VKNEWRPDKADVAGRTNEQRADAAMIALRRGGYLRAMADLEHAIVDVMSDLLHLIDRERVTRWSGTQWQETRLQKDQEEILALARMHYEEER